MKSKFLYFATPTLILYTVFVNISIVNAKTIDSFSKENNLPTIEATSAILIDAKTGLVLYEKNSNDKLYPASITKVMTALLTIENSNNDYTKEVLFSKNAVFNLPYNSSSIAMDEGETLTTEDALNGLLLASANEVANALSEHVGGSIEAFVALMNKRAKELGAKNTNFDNPHGLHSDNHYTTALDMALIMKEAIKHDEFLKIINTKNYKIPPTKKQPEERFLNNSNKLILPGKYYNEFVVGGKTGYTDEAKHTLVTYAKKDDISLICVILNSEKNIVYSDTTNLFDYGFNIYKNIEIFNKDNYTSTISVLDHEDKLVDQINAVAKENITMYLPDFINKQNIVITKTLPSSIKPPVIKDAMLGHITLSYNGIDISKVNLYAEKSVKETPKVLSTKNKKVVSNRITISSNIIKIAIITFSFLLIIPILFRLIIFLHSKKTIKRNKNMHKKLSDELNKKNEPLNTTRNYKYRNN